MKISKIHIHNYFQFQDLEIDLTYPKGHEKEGEALDKVCLIGQSGTGKTTLMELFLKTIEVLQSTKTGRKYTNLESKQGISFYFKKGDNTKIGATLSANNSNEVVHSSEEFEDISKIVNKVFYFPIEDHYSTISSDLLGDPQYSLEESIHIFDEFGLNNLWSASKKILETYQLDEADYRVQLTKKAEQQSNIDISQLIKSWKETHPNPLNEIAEACLNPILNHFHLAVKTEIEDYRNAEFLQIYSKLTNTIVPYNRLSTGTRQIIYTAFPIYQLLQENSIILMDEPENSLYPDIQKEIIDYYTSFDKDKQSQFFFATHSPIIASAFEPWEVVELKFDREGKVYRELYYDTNKDNHVKNYHTDPRYLRWDSILTKIFDLETEGNEPERSNMLMEFAILKRKVKKLEQEGKLQNPNKNTKEIVEEFQRVGELLDWETVNA